jgi:hypothetical protein
LTKLHLYTGGDVLTLRGLEDEVVVQKHHIVRSRPTSVRTICLVSVSVDDEVQ